MKAAYCNLPSQNPSQLLFKCSCVNALILVCLWTLNWRSCPAESEGTMLKWPWRNVLLWLSALFRDQRESTTLSWSFLGAFQRVSIKETNTVTFPSTLHCETWCTLPRINVPWKPSLSEVWHITGIIHPYNYNSVIIYSLSCHPLDFLSSMEHKRRCFEECSHCSC